MVNIQTDSTLHWWLIFITTEMVQGSERSKGGWVSLRWGYRVNGQGRMGNMGKTGNMGIRVRVSIRSSEVEQKRQRLELGTGS